MVVCGKGKLIEEKSITSTNNLQKKMEALKPQHTHNANTRNPHTKVGLNTC
jgi:hypothetical protein